MEFLVAGNSKFKRMRPKSCMLKFSIFFLLFCAKCQAGDFSELEQSEKSEGPETESSSEESLEIPESENVKPQIYTRTIVRPVSYSYISANIPNIRQTTRDLESFSSEKRDETVAVKEDLDDENEELKPSVSVQNGNSHVSSSGVVLGRLAVLPGNALDLNYKDYQGLIPAVNSYSELEGPEDESLQVTHSEVSSPINTGDGEGVSTLSHTRLRNETPWPNTHAKEFTASSQITTTPKVKSAHNKRNFRIIVADLPDHKLLYPQSKERLQETKFVDLPPRGLHSQQSSNPRKSHSTITTTFSSHTVNSIPYKEKPSRAVVYQRYESQTEAAIVDETENYPKTLLRLEDLLAFAGDQTSALETKILRQSAQWPPARSNQPRRQMRPNLPYIEFHPSQNVMSDYATPSPYRTNANNQPRENQPIITYVPHPEDKSAESEKVEVRGDSGEAYTKNDQAESATGHGGGGKKSGGKKSSGEGSQSEEHYVSKKGEKGEKGYEKGGKHTKAEKGHHEEEAHSGEYKEEKGEDKKHHKGEKYYGEHEKEEKGKKGKKYEGGKHHKKGHSTHGEHNIVKKDEYIKTTKFYDEDHDGGEQEEHGEYIGHHAEKEGGKKGGGHHQEEFQKKDHGKKGHHDKGHHEKDDKGFEHDEGHGSHYGSEESHGSKKGGHSSKKWKNR